MTRLASKFGIGLASMIALGSLLLLLCAGCGRAADNPAAATQSGATADPSDVPLNDADFVEPKDFTEAVRRIAGYRDEIRTAIEAGTPAKAHRPLDEFDLLVRRLMPLARTGGVAKDQWEKINLAGKQLQESFNKLHTAIDDHQSPDYAAVAPQIDAAIGTLEQAAEQAAAAKPAE